MLEYSEALAERPIWLVLNKIDLLDEAARAALVAQFQEAFPGEVIYTISAATGAGLDELINSLQREIALMRERLAADEEYAAAQSDLEARINEDVLASALNVRPQRIPPGPAGGEETVLAAGADDDDPEDDEPEVVYVHDDPAIGSQLDIYGSEPAIRRGDGTLEIASFKSCSARLDF